MPVSVTSHGAVATSGGITSQREVALFYKYVDVQDREHAASEQTVRALSDAYVTGSSPMYHV